MQKVEKYVATDGQMFDSAVDCKEHESMMLVATQVDEYLSDKAVKAGKELSKRARTRQKNLILDFLGWRSVASAEGKAA